ncbi:MAG: hypothetical protein ABI231_04570 [Candidatus Tumulicola sp.]
MNLAFDESGNLWVTDSAGGKVNIYPPGATTPSKSLTSGYTSAYGISIDKTVAAVVSNYSSPAAVYAYKPGKYKPYATLTNGISQAISLLLTKP